MPRNGSRREDKTLWVHCNQCLRDTRHDLITERTVAGEEIIDHGDEASCDVVNWTTTYTMLECRGCGAVVLRENLYCPEWGVDEVTHYPSPISRQIPRWHRELPMSFRDLMGEIYGALHAGSSRLAVMGARSLVDMFMNCTLGDIGGFQVRLDGLVEKGYLSKLNRDVLDAALEAGHAVIHRGHKPTVEDVSSVLDIVENLLQTVVLKKKADGLKRTTPKRKRT